MKKIKDYVSRSLGAILFLATASAVNAAVFQVTNTSDSGPGSLRQAILDANATVNDGTGDRIELVIPGTGQDSGLPTIQPLSPLPDISEAVVLFSLHDPNNSYFPHFHLNPVIQLDGSLAGTGVDGLRVVGGQTIIAGLIIRNFGGDGIEFSTGPQNVVANCVVSNNGGSGIRIVNSSSNLIGVQRDFSDPFDRGRGGRNTITDNTEHGIAISGTSNGNTVAENVITGNDRNGVLVEGGQFNAIGYGLVNPRRPFGFGNILSGNGANGVQLLGNSSGNSVVANLIGLAGSIGNFGTLVPNGLLPNGADGIDINGSAGNRIGADRDGGNRPWLGNIISANAKFGVNITNASGTVITSNFIGTDRNNANRGNRDDGIRLRDASNTIIGNDVSGRNVIAYNGGNGILLVSGRVNSFAGNYIFANVRMGIDLGADGVSLNDVQDRDEGANDLVNFPELLNAENIVGGGLGTYTRISVRYRGLPSTTVRVRFFANRRLDPGGYGEGERYIGGITLTQVATYGGVIVVS
jgi:parallel beta-helix repeat protein